MYKIRLVLVDDHVLFTEGLSAALAHEKDMEIIASFSDARKALKALENTKPELLVTDISMPNMNGLELIKMVKAKYPTIKILVASMFKEMVSLKDIDGYILKDSTVSKFSEAIRSIVLKGKKYFETKESDASIFEFSKNILTKREKEIVQLIANEYTVNEIAEKLFISRLTVESHKKNIFYKLKVNTNAGLIKKAVQLGFL